MSNQKQISTTALSKKFNIPSKEMFAHLLQKGFIEKKGDVWSLTNQGVDAGGKFITSKRFGKYITWPEDFQLDITEEKLITATAIGKQFSLSAKKINYILSELGWARKLSKVGVLRFKVKKLVVYRQRTKSLAFHIFVGLNQLLIPKYLQAPSKIFKEQNL